MVYRRFSEIWFTNVEIIVEKLQKYGTLGVAYQYWLNVVLYELYVSSRKVIMQLRIHVGTCVLCRDGVYAPYWLQTKKEWLGKIRQLPVYAYKGMWQNVKIDIF